MAISPDDVRAKVRAFIVESGVTAELDDTLDLFDSGLADSVFAHQLVLFVESEFDIQLDSDDLDIDNFRSVDSIVEFLSKEHSGVG